MTYRLPTTRKLRNIVFRRITQVSSVVRESQRGCANYATWNKEKEWQKAFKRARVADLLATFDHSYIGLFRWGIYFRRLTGYMSCLLVLFRQSAHHIVSCLYSISVKGVLRLFLFFPSCFRNERDQSLAVEIGSCENSTKSIVSQVHYWTYGKL